MLSGRAAVALIVAFFGFAMRCSLIQSAILSAKA
jgi:hypothetical protein